jgi:hypothetical protein
MWMQHLHQQYQLQINAASSNVLSEHPDCYNAVYEWKVIVA